MSEIFDVVTAGRGLESLGHMAINNLRPESIWVIFLRGAFTVERNAEKQAQTGF